MKFDTILFSMLTAAFFMMVTSGASAADKDAGENPVVIIKTNMGDIEVTLDAKRAPISVKNFLEYVEARFYDNTIFHRIIPGFMIQGGGYNINMVKLATRPPIVNEATNGLLNRRGTIAMARTPVPHSATSQFFINVENNTFLDNKDNTPQGFGYAVFGEITDGMKIVDAISKVKTRKDQISEGLPVEPVLIETITLKKAE